MFPPSLFKSSKLAPKMKFPSVRFYFMFLPWKQICVECILKKSHNFRFTAQKLLLFTMCTYICTGKGPEQRKLPNPETVCGLSRNSDAFAVQLDVFFTLSLPGAMSKTRCPCPSLVLHVPIWWLCSRGWEEILRVKTFDIRLISSLKLSRLQRKAFRGSLTICF